MLRLFCIFLISLPLSLSALSLLFPEESSYAEESKLCYQPLQTKISNQSLSPSPNQINDKLIESLARESAEIRMASIECLRAYAKTPEEREDMQRSYEKSLEREDNLEALEKKILIGANREYHLTPIEIQTSEEYFQTRQIIREGIRSFTKEAILLSEKEFRKEKKNLQLEFYLRYGSLLREREKFLFRLTIESRRSYLKFLETFTEKG
ncbi:hypothetical protein LPTSP4_12830 [Leptospira ryugenii]|uniref:Uncharacterized protein n=1 Tax=Leptospira ryugenii TaxID=1917863 RepID=A0A2P2DYR6_9LEPT|nr:hypothetical protein [Leptospira ryugenii]GBF49764.1 hypothetical protein LPTSP4_12830 [Leptospira ryugenii]